VYWYEKPKNQGTCPSGVISLRFCQRVEAVEKSETGFIIVLPERVYELEASSAHDRSEWISGIIKNIAIYHKVAQHTRNDVFGGLSQDSLRKEGPFDVKSSIFGWQARYLILVDGMLFSFLHQTGPRVHKIALYGCDITEYKVRNSARFALSIKTSTGATFPISCKNKDELLEWSRALNHQIKLIESAVGHIKL